KPSGLTGVRFASRLRRRSVSVVEIMTMSDPRPSELWCSKSTEARHVFLRKTRHIVGYFTLSVHSFRLWLTHFPPSERGMVLTVGNGRVIKHVASGHAR